MRNMIFKKARKLFGENSCFLCGKTLEEHIQDTGKGFVMYCRTENHNLMKAWNWKTLCKKCLPIVEKIENQVLD